MILVIDIGNTHTVFGIFDGPELKDHWRITSALVRTEDEIGLWLKNYFDHSGFAFSDINGVCLSSVVPALSKSYIWMSHKYLKKEALVIDSSLDFGLKIKYSDPKSVGADRLCNAVAGIEKYGKPLIILDFGTATTFDCIDKDGDYAGGVIAPGIETSIHSLALRAAKLPQVELKIPDAVIGLSTEESIQIGIIKGTIHLVKGIVQDLKKELGENTKVIATGGLASVISQQTNVIDEVDSFLSLRGCVSIYLRNQGS